MKKFSAVRGTADKIPSLEVNVDTVYIRSNVDRIETEGFSGWQYDEIQYSLREYQELVGNATNVLHLDVNDVADVVAITIEDIISVAELVAYLIEQNTLLTERIERLENGGNV